MCVEGAFNVHSSCISVAFFLMHLQCTLEVQNSSQIEYQSLRVKMVGILQNCDYVQDFNRNLVKSTMPDPRTFEQLSYLLQQRDQVEYHLELMHDDRNAAGEPLDPKRNIEPRYDKLSQTVVDLNRRMFTLFVDFLAPSEPEHAS